MNDKKETARMICKLLENYTTSQLAQRLITTNARIEDMASEKLGTINNSFIERLVEFYNEVYDESKS